jgi:hypothetical protein
MTPEAPHGPTANLAALLNTRGWGFNAELSSTGSPAWDFVPSMPRSENLGPEGHPTGIFIHTPEEPRFCTVEPASWSTQRNPYSRTFRDVSELFSCLPQIEHWRAPASVTHATPAELARMRSTGAITTAELIYSLEHFPYRPRQQSSFGDLRLIRDVGLLASKEFELLVASIQLARQAQAHDLTPE